MAASATYIGSNPVEKSNRTIYTGIANGWSRYEVTLLA